ncbi:WD40 repeat-like protein [Laetiporus sulphureus 93-53]|uniref:WD40 repeat-like protein n=1 Tax=Laetiporus sulphureus 93-53 TaxID=1314785 RepID=A0A165IMP5_9APHY|nr:WD40 repeat-like protein [Laetiporus sulphureus 93-53]KZT13292.1 WD40 repeat-like protein [Laetiporus sulphureus 93-53]
MSACDVYSKALFRVGHGYPLWDPEPTKHGEVRVGDVGFLADGALFRLFNVLAPADDAVQTKYGVYKGYEPFKRKTDYGNNNERHIGPGPVCSKTVKHLGASGSLSVQGAGASFEFECIDEQGALLVLKEGAHRNVMLPSRRLANYMSRNLAKWVLFAQDDNDVAVQKEAIMLVTGVIKTTEWAIAAFVHHGRSAKVAFDAQAASIGKAAFSLTSSMTVSTAPEQKVGPSSRFNTGDPKSPKSGKQQTEAQSGGQKHQKQSGKQRPQKQSEKQQGKRPMKNNKRNQQQEATHDSEDDNDDQNNDDGDRSASHVVEPKRDQCVFVNYYKVKYRLGFWPRVLKAAAGDPDLPPGPDDDHNEGSASARNGDDVTDEDVEIEHFPVFEKAYDPVEFLLDYILKYSEANMAIAHDQDILRLCQQHNTEIPNNIPEFLEIVRPLIEVNEDGLGILSLEDFSFNEADGTNDQAIAVTSHDPAKYDTSKGEDDVHKSDDKVEWKVGGFGDSRTLDEHTGGICALAYSPNGRYIATGSENAIVTIWDAQSGRRLHTCEQHMDAVCSLAFSPDSTQVVSGSRDGTAIVWGIADGALVIMLRGHQGFVYSVSWSPDNKTIATGSVDFTMRLWDASTGAQRSISDDHSGIVMLVAFSPDSTRVVSAGADYSARVWDATNGQQISVYEGHEGIIYSMAFSPDSRRIVSGSDDGTARIWYAQSADELVALHKHDGSVWAVAFSLDLKKVLSAASDGTVEASDSYTGESLLSIGADGSLINMAAFSHDGKRICASLADNTIKVWNAETGAEVSTLTGHTDKVSLLQFAPNGQQIVSASDDGTLRLWNV